MGALLDLHIGFGYVLSHDTQAEKLQAADEDDDTDGGSPAWDRIIEDQLSDDDGYQDQKGKTGHGRSEPGGDGQRYLRKIDDAADGVFKQLPEVPFGLTGYAFDIFVGEQQVRKPIQPKIPLEKRLYSLMETMASTILRFIRRKSLAPSTISASEILLIS